MSAISTSAQSADGAAALLVGKHAFPQARKKGLPWPSIFGRQHDDVVGHEEPDALYGKIGERDLLRVDGMAVAILASERGAAVGLRPAFPRERSDSASLRTRSACAGAGPGPRRHGAAHPHHDGVALSRQRADAGSALAAAAGAGGQLENSKFHSRRLSDALTKSPHNKLCKLLRTLSGFVR